MKELIKNSNNKFELLILKYFDVFEQQVTICNVILIEATVTYKRLFNYIQHEFIIQNNNNFNHDCYNKFRNQLKEIYHVNSDHTPFSAFHQNGKYVAIVSYFAFDMAVSSKISNNTLVFSFNYQHPFITNRVKIITESNYITFHPNFYSFARIQKEFFNTTVTLSSDQLSNISLLKQFVCHFNGDCTQKQYQKFIQTVTKPFIFRVLPEWRLGYIRQQIASQIDCDFITANNIEIFLPLHATEIHVKKWDDKIWNFTQYEWRFVLYDTKVTTSTDRIYKINVFLSHPSDAIKYKPKS
eukprot:90743_1